MGTSRIKKEWELALSNYRIHAGESPLPPCPICLRPMTLFGSENAVKVSRGHLFPKSCDPNRPFVAEREHCNNAFGSRYESELAHQVWVDRFRMKEISPPETIKLFNARRDVVTVNGNSCRSFAQIENDGVSLTLDIEGGQLRPDLPDLAVKDADLSSALVALLHVAYLRMFHTWGYEYVFDPAVDELRNDLAWAARAPRSAESVARRFWRYNGAREAHEKLGEWHELIIATKPRELATFMVFVPVLKQRSYAVLVPGFGEAARIAYERARGAKRPIDIEAASIELPLTREIRLTSPAWKNGGAFQWSAFVD